MHRRSRVIALTVVAIVVAALVVGLIWWRDRPVQVSVPAGGGDPACAELAAALPATVHHQDRVATSTDSAAVAAWGDPAVIWRCGVAPPGPTTRECLDVSGVDWVVTPLDDGTGFTTYGRDPAVQVLVPKAYAPEPLVLPPFSAVVSALPQGDRRCS